MGCRTSDITRQHLDFPIKRFDESTGTSCTGRLPQLTARNLSSVPRTSPPDPPGSAHSFSPPLRREPSENKNKSAQSAQRPPGHVTHAAPTWIPPLACVDSPPYKNCILPRTRQRDSEVATAQTEDTFFERQFGRVKSGPIHHHNAIRHVTARCWHLGSAASEKQSGL